MGQLLAFEKQLNPDITTHGIVVKYKEETKYKRSSPTSEEEVDLMTKSSKSDCNITNTNENNTCDKSKPDNRRTVDFSCNISRCTLEARKNGLKLLPLKGNCVSVPNTV